MPGSSCPQNFITPETVAAGWISVMVALFVLCGIQLLFLGVVGEYVGRVLLMVNGKPQFLVKETYHVEQQADARKDTGKDV